MIRLPGSVADIIAPNTRQSVKASQLGYSRRVKPNMRPLQLHHKHNTLLCIHLKTNHINSILLFISDLECTDKSDTVTKNCTGTFHSHHDECVKPGIHYPCSRPMFTIDISDTHEHWTWAVQYTWAPVHTTYVHGLWTPPPRPVFKVDVFHTHEHWTRAMNMGGCPHCWVHGPVHEPWTGNVYRALEKITWNWQ